MTDSNSGRWTDANIPGYEWARLLVGFVACFWLWAKFLYSPQIVYLPPLPPVEVFFSDIQKFLGPWPAVLIPLAGLLYIAWDGVARWRIGKLGGWTRRVLTGVGMTVLVHVSAWALGSLLFFVILSLPRGFDFGKDAASRATLSGLILFCAFLALIVAGPATLISMAVETLRRRGRERFPGTRLQALNTLWAVLAIPLLVLWGISGDPGASLQAIGQADQARAVERRAALLEAARSGDAESVKSLLRERAETDARDRTGMTPLMAAAANGYAEIVRELIRADADINARNEIGRTALISASSNRHAAIVQALIESRADVNAKDADGRTALMLAASAGGADIVRALLYAGANLKAKDRQGSTALDYALRSNHSEIVLTLREAAAPK